MASPLEIKKYSRKSGRRFALGLFAALGFSEGAAAQEIPTVSYERPEDVGASAAIVGRLGDGPYAANGKEARKNFDEALDACMKSENLPPELRSQLKAIALGPINFSDFPVTGVDPNYISPDETADCMVGRDKKGNVVVLGKGSDIVRLQTDRVKNTRTGQIGYPAERRAGVITLNGRKALAVWTLPAECNNWTLKIIYLPEAPAPVISPESGECTEVEMQLPPGTVARALIVYARRNGTKLTEREAKSLRSCVAKTLARGALTRLNCKDEGCKFEDNALRDISNAIKDTLPGVELSTEVREVLQSDRDGKMTIDVPTDEGIFVPFCFDVLNTKGEIVAVSNVFWVDPGDLKDAGSKRVFTREELKKNLKWFGPNGRLDWENDALRGNGYTVQWGEVSSGQ